MTRINITPLDDEERERLILMLRSGDVNAIEPIISSYVPMAHKYAMEKHEKYPYLTEEITASAMLGLAYAVNRVQRGHLKDGVDIEGYLVPFIRSEIRDCILGDFIISISRWYLEHDYEVPIFVSTNSIVARNIPFKDFRERFDQIDELIAEIGYSDREIKIIKLRLDGHTYQEIGHYLNIHLSRVFQILKIIQQKWIKYHKLLGGTYDDKD